MAGMENMKLDFARVAYAQTAGNYCEKLALAVKEGRLKDAYEAWVDVSIRLFCLFDDAPGVVDELVGVMKSTLAYQKGLLDKFDPEVENGPGDISEDSGGEDKGERGGASGEGGGVLKE